MYTTVSARLDARLKEEAEAVLSALGISHSAAIAALYSQIVFQQGLPFDVRIPRKNARMGLSYWELRDAVRGIAESCEVRAVWLYGPYAIGAADAGSSIDLRIDAEEGSDFDTESFARAVEHLLGVPVRASLTPNLSRKFLNAIKETEEILYERG